MPRNRPTSNTDTYGPWERNPEESVCSYIQSKQQEAYFVKPPNWDSPGDSIELLYLHNEREHEAMLSLQREMMQHMRRQNFANYTRIWKQGKTMLKLRKRFIEVNTFIKDCEEKKLLAERKIREEKAKHNKTRKLITDTKRDIHQLTDFRIRLLNTVKEYEPYEMVLLDVVEKSDIYNSIQDLMERCDALMLAQVETSTLEKEKLLEVEEMRKHILNLTNQAALAVMGLKNELGDVQRSYTIATQKCMKWEKKLEKAKACTCGISMSQERMLDGVHQIYRMLCDRARIEPKFQRYEIEGQLDFIKDEIEVMQDVLTVISEQNQKSVKARKVAKKKEQIPC